MMAAGRRERTITLSAREMASERSCVTRSADFFSFRMLSDGEKCGCKILDKFNITQPTLSHHMKILVDCGIVNDRKEGKRHYYSLNKKVIREASSFVEALGR